MKLVADCSFASLALRQKGRWSPHHLFHSGIPGAIYDPSAPGGVFSDVQGTLPATAAGDPVARIEDLSGNGSHLIQEDPLDCPGLAVSGDRRWVEFDGSNSLVSAAGPEHWSWLHQDAGSTVAISAHVSHRTDASEYIVGTVSGSATAELGLAIQSDNRSEYNIPKWARILVARGVAGEPASFIGTPDPSQQKHWIISASSGGIELDGGATQYSVPWMNVPSGSAPVHSLKIGRSGQNALIGSVGAVVVIARELDQSEKRFLRQWLVQRGQ